MDQHCKEMIMLKATASKVTRGLLENDDVTKKDASGFYRVCSNGTFYSSDTQDSETPTNCGSYIAF